MFRHLGCDPSMTWKVRHMFLHVGHLECVISRPQMSVKSGSYQKLKDIAMDNTWKKFGAFIRNVHIHFIFWHKLPDYNWQLHFRWIQRSN